LLSFSLVLISSLKLNIVILFLLALFLIAPTAKPANYLRMTEVSEMRFAGAGVLISPLVNPSLLAEETHRKAAFSIIENFGVKELTKLSVAILYPNPWLPATLHVETFGFHAYRETLLKGAVGRKLGTAWDLGIAFRYAVLQTELFDEQGACLAADVGLRFAPQERFSLALALTNIVAVPSGQGAHTMASAQWFAEAGMEWKIVDKLRLLGAFGKGRYTSSGGNIGLEYAFDERFRVSGGIRSSPWLTAIGAAYQGSLFVIDIAATVHPILGMSWGVGFSILF
jgi:hypothetical protein